LRDPAQKQLVRLFFLSKKGGFESGIDLNVVELFCNKYKNLNWDTFDTFELLKGIYNKVMEK